MSLTLLVIFVARINRGDSVQPLIFIPLQFRASGDTLCMHIPSPTLLILILFSNANADRDGIGAWHVTRS